MLRQFTRRGITIAVGFSESEITRELRGDTAAKLGSLLHYPGAPARPPGLLPQRLGIIATMRTVVIGPNPDVEAIIARRQALGVDRYDEVWEGEYHITPGPSGPHAVLDHSLALFLGPRAKAAGLVGTSAFNLGQPNDYRVPDGGYHLEAPTGTWVPTAAVVVEIVSPDDETYDKFGFYARRANELIVVDPTKRTVECYVSDGQHLVTADGSVLLGVSAREIAEALPWP